MEDENRATTSPFHQQTICSNVRSTDRSWANQSRTEPSDSWCNAAPEHRTWQTNRSLHNLSNCIDKHFDVVFRRCGQNAMTQTTNPAGPVAAFQRREIIGQVLLQFIAGRVQESLIEVALHEPSGGQVERFANVPAVIDTDTGEGVR